MFSLYAKTTRLIFTKFVKQVVCMSRKKQLDLDGNADNVM